MTKKINFDILESLRGLAALYVCIGHCRGMLWIGGEHYLKLHPRSTLGVEDYVILLLNMLTRLSSEFVIIFFVLSGFSIAHSLRNSKSPGPFYKRRFVRLYPPYFVALLWAMLIVAVISWIAPHFIDGTYSTPAFDRLYNSRQLFTWRVFLGNLFYLPHLDGVLRPFWSLTQEVIFYLFAPFVFRSKNAYFISSVFLFVLGRVGLYYQFLTDNIITSYFFYNMFFAIGVYLYDNYDTVVKKAGFLLTKKAVWISVILFFIMIAVSLMHYETLNAFIAAGFSAILIIFLVANNIEIKWLIGVGRFSYTLYITHFPTICLYMALFFLATQAPPYIYNNLVFIPCVFVCVGIAYLHYTLVEKKSKAVLDKLRGKNERTKTKLHSSAIEVQKGQW